MQKLLLETALLPEGWRDNVLLSVDQGRIAAVSIDPPPAERDGARRVAGIAVPGVANLHSHTFQRGFAGLTERRGSGDDHFWTWREQMYRFVGRLSPEDVEAVAALAFIEMLESGFTSVAEFHYLHHAPDGRSYAEPAELATRIVAAAQATGIGLTLLPVFYAHGGFGDRPSTPGQTRFVCDLDRFGRVFEGAATAVATLPHGRTGIAPHSLRAVNAAELAALVEAHPAGPIHIHVAEQTLEVEACLAATGARPVQWLLDHAPVDHRWCFIHATHMTGVETERLAASNAVAGLCPITESNLGDGIFPAFDLLDADGRIGVGSDSNVLISLPGELRTLEYSQRLRDRARNRLGNPNASTGRHLFEAVARGGAQALDRPIGALAPGLLADFAVLDKAGLALHGRHGDAVLDTWIFAAAPSLVRDVVVGGETVVRDGRHVGRDQAERQFRQAMDRLAG